MKQILLTLACIFLYLCCIAQEKSMLILQWQNILRLVSVNMDTNMAGI